ncbi:MAG: hypothetical protein AAF800_03305 [Planctomycetota bacterium]
MSNENESSGGNRWVATTLWLALCVTVILPMVVLLAFGVLRITLLVLTGGADASTDPA